jgi:hypothetical protein
MTTVRVPIEEIDLAFRMVIFVARFTDAIPPTLAAIGLSQLSSAGDA